ncbi:hypothetical protein [Streptomyces sp. NPDC003036]|uniref:hypothetical protein n=1 Tax=Streptomyces sp. NPDC003036 TaxID=3154442 RepID=UPI0033A626E7
MQSSPAAQQPGPQPWRRPPEEWGAVLTRARLRRAFNAPPPATVPVRLYVLDPRERARARGLLEAGR